MQITVASDDPSEDEQVVGCLAKLESLKGTASRRAALDTALKTISSDEVKQHLRIEASRLEVMAVLDKVDTLTSLRAKKRHLLAALDDIRNDGVDASLQFRQIDMLESALREIDKPSQTT